MFSALGVSHVMRSINVRYLLTYLPHTQGAQVRITVLLANYTAPASTSFTGWHLPSLMLWTYNCSLLLTYLPKKDERLSRPGWLTYSGQFTHISVHPSAAGKVRRSKTDILPLCQATNVDV